MLRWSILIATLVLWLACMTLVYLHCRPQLQKDGASGALASLDTLFAEDAETERGCRIFVDLTKMKSGTAEVKSTAALIPWSGLDESKLTEVGWMKTTIKKKTADATRLELVTDAELQIPSDPNMPVLGMMKMFLGSLFYHARADITLDQGLETFDSDMVSATGGLKAHAHGVRDGEFLNVIQQIFQGETKLLDQHQKLPVGPKDTPTLELMPFQTTTLDIRPGTEWNISMLDTSNIDVLSNAPPHVANMKVKCTGKRRILYDKEGVMVFEVCTEDNQARAWYSADGMVLKQSCKLFDTLEVMVVRIPKPKLKDFFLSKTPGANPGNPAGAAKQGERP